MTGFQSYSSYLVSVNGYGKVRKLFLKVEDLSYLNQQNYLCMTGSDLKKVWEVNFEFPTSLKATDLMWSSRSL